MDYKLFGGAILLHSCDARVDVVARDRAGEPPDQVH